jgi:hypothetical protein
MPIVQLRTVAIASVACASLLAACGGSSGNSDSASSPTTTAGTGTTEHVAKLASNNPSESAKMICASEAANDIYEQATGVKTIKPLKPTWVDHVYSCAYVYPNGAVMRLSVKELSSDAETTAYFDSLAQKLGKVKDRPEVGKAFTTRDGSLVVRKDYKVLTVDVSKLPASFGVPSDSREDVAINTGVTIMGCWTGA